MSWLLPRLGWLLAAGLFAGCNCGSTPTRPGGRDGGDGASAGGETGAQCVDGIDNDRDGATDCEQVSCFAEPACRPDAGPRPDAGFTECEAVSVQAETGVAPVDIVWIIDNSGSMDEETRLIQNNINQFVRDLVASGIEDYHVVVITDPSAHGLSVPPPLGTDTMRFRLVVFDVQSHDALSDLIASYDLWRDFIRRNSVLHFVHVTDDESDLGWMEFRTRMTALLAMDRDSGTFTSHAIASPPGSRHCSSPFGCGGIIPKEDGCAGSYGDAADNCDECWGIAGATGGQRISICSSDWSAVFATLLTSIAVPMPLPCEYAIPDPPEGMTFDRMRVNVVYTPGGGGAPRTLPYRGTSDGGDCTGEAEGWYYDDPTSPTRILLCPASCAVLEADATARVDIALGCETFFG